METEKVIKTQPPPPQDSNGGGGREGDSGKGIGGGGENKKKKKSVEKGTKKPMASAFDCAWGCVKLFPTVREGRGESRGNATATGGT